VYGDEKVFEEFLVDFFVETKEDEEEEEEDTENVHI